jgi:hypothetical protein
LALVEVAQPLDVRAAVGVRFAIARTHASIIPVADIPALIL